MGILVLMRICSKNVLFYKELVIENVQVYMFFSIFWDLTDYIIVMTAGIKQDFEKCFDFCGIVNVT